MKELTLQQVCAPLSILSNTHIDIHIVLFWVVVIIIIIVAFASCYNWVFLVMHTERALEVMQIFTNSSGNGLSATFLPNVARRG